MSSSLEKQLDKIHTHLDTPLRYDENALPRPFFVEFIGTPTAGKSTLIKELYNLLKRSGFKILIPQEGAGVIPHTIRNSPLI